MNEDEKGKGEDGGKGENKPQTPSATVGEFPYLRLTRVLEEIQAEQAAHRKDQKPAA